MTVYTCVQFVREANVQVCWFESGKNRTAHFSTHAPSELLLVDRPFFLGDVVQKRSTTADPNESGYA
jgi:hypothetical protein